MLPLIAVALREDEKLWCVPGSALYAPKEQAHNRPTLLRAKSVDREAEAFPCIERLNSMSLLYALVQCSALVPHFLELSARVDGPLEGGAFSVTKL